MIEDYAITKGEMKWKEYGLKITPKGLQQT